MSHPTGMQHKSTHTLYRFICVQHISLLYILNHDTEYQTEPTGTLIKRANTSTLTVNYVNADVQ